MQERPSRRGPHWVPSVNPVELRKVWNFWRDFEAHHPGAGVGRALAEIERGLTSDPNCWASYRAALLYMMTLCPDDPLDKTYVSPDFVEEAPLL